MSRNPLVPPHWNPSFTPEVRKTWFWLGGDTPPAESALLPGPQQCIYHPLKLNRIQVPLQARHRPVQALRPV